MFIYFRACEKQPTISHVNRYKNTKKVDMLKKCWLSIQASILKEDTVILIVDSVSDSTISWLLDTCATPSIIVEKVPPHDFNNHLHTVILIDLLDKYTQEFPDNIHYIVEDDYLHLPNAITVLKTNLRNWDGFALSYDYPDRYILDPCYCRVVIGYDRHWRTVNSSTMTVLAKGKIWQKVIDKLKQVANTSNDQIFKEIYEEIPCLSPLPSLSTHLTDRHLSPLVDWDKVWELYKIE